LGVDVDLTRSASTVKPANISEHQQTHNGLSGTASFWQCRGSAIGEIRIRRVPAPRTHERP
jgi:hypothetical protein